MLFFEFFGIIMQDRSDFVMENKYIHYCWFGSKPLSKLARKCIKSWQKYLPDFEIIKWDEGNCDINECSFVKEAYESKNWAFVADYFRTKALYEMGGIYFDTDMEIMRNIDVFLEDKTFLGVEDSGFIAVGVWWEKNSKAILPQKLLNFYRSQDGFYPEKKYNYSIPRLITNELLDLNYDNNNINMIQNINGIVIYPRDYFYPLSYDRQNNLFTDNTCMIHYYDATWVPKYEKRYNNLVKKYGKSKAKKIFDIEDKIKNYIKKILKVCLFPLVVYRCNKSANKFARESFNKFSDDIDKINFGDYIVFYNQNWLGTTQATKYIFNNTVALRDFEKNKQYDKYIDAILEKKPSLVIFSAFCLSWAYIVDKLFEQNIAVKILWHGSNAMNIDEYDYKVFSKVMNFLNTNKIVSLGFVKKSMYDLYKEKGYNVEFVKNSVILDDKYTVNESDKTGGKIRIGIYASGDRWVKNFYNQLSGASLIDNVIIDIVPLSNKTHEFAKSLGCNITGTPSNISHDEMLKRISKNDINIYATFVECAPIIPLESLELGVPCITGNNHHYWENSELEKYLVINKVDNPVAIAKQIELVLKNKAHILNLYKDWKRKYDVESKKSVKDFLNIKKIREK